MAIVAHGLGQPEQGAIVASGLGAAETDPNGLRATLAGSSTLTATLTDGATPAEPTPTGGGVRPYRLPYVPYQPKPKPEPIPGYLAAHLSGSSHLTARIDFEIDPDYLAAQLAEALLLDLV